MTAITAKPLRLSHTAIMQRVIDEAEYVLTILQRMRDESCSHPDLYDPGAQKQMDEAIAHVEDVLRNARSILRGGGQSPKAA